MENQPTWAEKIAGVSDRKPIPRDPDTEFGRYEFKIGNKEIATNCRDALVKFDRMSNSWISASALTYDTFEHAALMFEVHRTVVRAGGVRIAHPIGYTRLDGQGILFLERLKESSKVFGRGDPLWNKGIRVHFGENYTNKFKQILEGLKSLHKLNISHGQLSEGYLFGEDGNVLLYNLEVRRGAKQELLVEDYKDFCHLIQGVIDSNFNPTNVPPHVELFFSMVHWQWPAHPTNFEERMEFIHNSPLFWSDAKKSAFIDTLALVMQQDKNYIDSNFNLSIYFSGWNTTFAGKRRFEECFTFKNRHLDKNNWYHSDSGVIVFGRNFKVHYGFATDVTLELEIQFPYIVAGTYYKLVEGKGGFKDKQLSVGRVHPDAGDRPENMTVMTFLNKTLAYIV